MSISEKEWEDLDSIYGSYFTIFDFIGVYPQSQQEVSDSLAQIKKQEALSILNGNKDEWCVVVQSDEVCVIHRDNHHGIISLGWYDEHKIRVGRFDDNEYQDRSKHVLVTLANEIAKELNNSKQEKL